MTNTPRKIRATKHATLGELLDKPSPEFEVCCLPTKIFFVSLNKMIKF